MAQIIATRAYLLCAIFALVINPTHANDRTYSSSDKVTILGCKSYNYCNGHGTCKYNYNECDCDEGWGSPREIAILGFRPSYDCTKKVCALGYAWGDQPAPNSTTNTNTNKAHEMHECSNMGICDREEGVCACFTGYRGASCSKRSCPGKGDCSGHGKCVSMSVQTRMPDALPLTNANNKTSSGYYEPGGHQGSTWDSNRLFGCVCDSSWPVGLGAGETQQPEWFGADCSLKRCPTGNNPGTNGVDETDGFNKTADGGNGVGKAGNKIHVDCSGKGRCDFKSGTCQCFQGYYGENCGIVDAKSTGT